MRIIGYERVSTARQGASGLGIEAQRQAIEGFVTQKKGTLLARFAAPAAETEPERTLTMAHAMNLNAYADTTEQPGIFARLRHSFADYREYLVTYHELNALSERELADIGLSRLNVRDIARAAVYGS